MSKPNIFRNKNGITLIELMVVISILGVILYFAIPIYVAYKRSKPPNLPSVPASGGDLFTLIYVLAGVVLTIVIIIYVINPLIRRKG
jgi:prepilin-type N-terminal cleavage/methylation domain-containing protein